MQLTNEETEGLKVSQAVKNLVTDMDVRPDDFIVSIEAHGWYKIHDTKLSIGGSVVHSRSNSFGVVEGYAIGQYSFMNILEIEEVFAAAKQLSRYKASVELDSCKRQFEEAYKEV